VTGSGTTGKLELKPDAKPTVDAKLPSAAKGTMLVGTFKSAYEAFTNDVYKAAVASMTKSGQGIYFQPDGDKTWYRLDQATDGEAALKPGGNTALAPEDEKGLKVEVVVDKPGVVKTALPPDELKKQLDTLGKDKEKLETDKQAAVDAQKMGDAASIAAQLQDVAAQIGMLEALQKGDAKAAWQQMAKVNNPEAAAAALVAGADGAAPAAGGASGGKGDGGAAPDGDKPGGSAGSGTTAGGSSPNGGDTAGNGASSGTAAGSGAGSGTAAGGTSPNGGDTAGGDKPGGDTAGSGADSGKPGGSSAGENAGNGAANGGAAEPPSELELSDAADAADAKLAAALGAGDGAAAAQGAQAAMQAAFALADAQGGTADALQVLAEAKANTSAALDAAKAGGDAAQAEQLAATLQAEQAAALQAEKGALFAKLDIVQTKLDELTDPDADVMPAPGSPQEAAQQQAEAALQQLAQELIGQIEQKELAKYTAEEQSALQQQAQLIDAGQAATEGVPAETKLATAPVQSLISGDFDVKLDVPPVVVGDNRFLPLRAVSESFGATVDWDDETQTATVTTENGTVSCTIGSKTAYVDGDPVELDMPAVLVEGRTQVPLRLIADSIGLQVKWNDATQTVQIAE
jgi:hypothetical protein